MQSGFQHERNVHRNLQVPHTMSTANLTHGKHRIIQWDNPHNTRKVAATLSPSVKEQQRLQLAADIEAYYRRQANEKSNVPRLS